MSIVNPLAREIAAKVVYYGPGLSGKTTTLRHIHASAEAKSRGQLVSLSTEGDRTLFFDFLPLQIEPVNGFSVRLQLYTVPGQVFYDSTRKLVLNGADGIVFVADSQPTTRDSNLESMDNLSTNLAEQGIQLAAFPLVLQYNKRDLPGVMPVADMRAELNPRGVPDFETVAARGDGVLEALSEIARLVVKDLKSRRPVRRKPAVDATPGSDLAQQISAAAEAASRSAPRPHGAVSSAPSFSRLFPSSPVRIAEVETAIRQRTYGVAIRTAANAVAELLDRLPLNEPSDTARAMLLGLDGREYLRLCKLAGNPDSSATEQDALFALYVLVATKIKAARI